MEQRLAGMIRQLKPMADLPMYVGFGIRTPEDVKTILSYGADGVIVGSAIAAIYEKYSGKTAMERRALIEIAKLVRSLS